MTTMSVAALFTALMISQPLTLMDSTHSAAAAAQLLQPSRHRATPFGSVGRRSVLIGASNSLVMNEAASIPPPSRQGRRRNSRRRLWLSSVVRSPGIMIVVVRPSVRSVLSSRSTRQLTSFPWRRRRRRRCWARRRRLNRRGAPARARSRPESCGRAKTR